MTEDEEDRWALEVANKIHRLYRREQRLIAEENAEHERERQETAKRIGYVAPDHAETEALVERIRALTRR